MFSFSDRPFRERLTSLFRVLRGLDAWALLFLGLAGLGISVGYGGSSTPPPPMAAFSHPAALCALVFSPDGRLVATSDADGGVDILDRDSGEEWSVPGGSAGTEPSLAFSPDGRFLAIMEWAGSIRLWDVRGNREFARLNAEGLRTVSFAENGTLLAVTNLSKRRVTRWDWANNRHETLLNGQLDRAVAVAISADGRTLAASFLNATIKLWNLSTGQPIATMPAASRATVALAFSCDGTILASAGNESQDVWLWDTTSGRSRGALRSGVHSVTAVAFTPDGSQLVLTGTDGILHIRDLSSGVERMTLRASDGVQRFLAISPDGRTLAAAGMDRTLRLWDLARVPSANEGL